MTYLESEHNFHSKNGSVDNNILILNSNGHFVLGAAECQNEKKSIMDNFFDWMAKLISFSDSQARNHVKTIKIQAFIHHFSFLKNGARWTGWRISSFWDFVRPTWRIVSRKIPLNFSSTKLRVWSLHMLLNESFSNFIFFFFFKKITNFREFFDIFVRKWPLADRPRYENEREFY